MQVSSLIVSGYASSFIHKNDSLYVTIEQPSKDHYYELSVNFKGVPEDGLVIGKNKFGARTFFGDNWPNRAQNWFACNDHLLDKSSIEYIVNALKSILLSQMEGLSQFKKRKK